MQRITKIMMAATLAVAVGAMTKAGATSAQGATPDGPKAVAAPEAPAMSQSEAKQGEASFDTPPETMSPNSFAGCPSGDVCIYAGPSWDGGPIAYAYRYACYDIPYFGVHRVFNNQTGGATASFYLANGCGNYWWTLNANSYTDVDLGLIYSMSLDPCAPPPPSTCG